MESPQKRSGIEGELHDFWQNLYETSCDLLYRAISSQFVVPSTIECRTLYEYNMIMLGETLHRMSRMLGMEVLHARQAPFTFWQGFAEIFARQIRQVVLERNAGLLTSDGVPVPSQDVVLKPFLKRIPISVDMTVFLEWEKIQPVLTQLFPLKNDDPIPARYLRSLFESQNGGVLGVKIPPPTVSLTKHPDDPDKLAFLVQGIRLHDGVKVVPLQLSDTSQLRVLFTQMLAIKRLEVNCPDGDSEKTNLVRARFWQNLFDRCLDRAERQCNPTVIDQSAMRELTQRSAEYAQRQYEGSRVAVECYV